VQRDEIAGREQFVELQPACSWHVGVLVVVGRADHGERAARCREARAVLVEEDPAVCALASSASAGGWSRPPSSPPSRSARLRLPSAAPMAWSASCPCCTAYPGRSTPQRSLCSPTQAAQPNLHALKPAQLATATAWPPGDLDQLIPGTERHDHEDFYYRNGGKSLRDHEVAYGLIALPTHSKDAPQLAFRRLRLR